MIFFNQHQRKYSCLSKDFQKNKKISYNNGGISNDDTSNFVVDILYHAVHFLFSLGREDFFSWKLDAACGWIHYGSLYIGYW